MYPNETSPINLKSKVVAHDGRVREGEIKAANQIRISPPN